MEKEEEKIRYDLLYSIRSFKLDNICINLF